MGRIWMALGALAGAGAVGMAAATAHALSQHLDGAGADALRSAVQMQGWHALALILTGLWVMRAPKRAGRLANLAGFGFSAGMLLFCGAVYAHRMAGFSPGPMAPIGGVSLMLAWVCLAASALVAGPTL